MRNRRANSGKQCQTLFFGAEIPHARMPEAKGIGREEQPHDQGAVAAWVQEGLQELSHAEGQEGRRWRDTPRPR